jgi:hypothetical protein
VQLLQWLLLITHQVYRELRAEEEAELLQDLVLQENHIQGYQEIYAKPE